MEKYELVLEKFLSNYKEHPHFEGAVLCGSYASGNQTPSSDVDVHIVMSDAEFAKWYHLNKQPDEEFKELTLACLHADNRDKVKCIQNLYHFVVNACGGFDISQFKLRGQIKRY